MKNGSSVSRRARLVRLALAGSAAMAPCLVAAPAWAQLQLGGIQGTITNQDTDKPFPGVTVVVSGPALQGDQTEVTDQNGRYLITQLPSGDNYVVRFYFNDVVVERPGVHVTQNKTLNISLAMPSHKGAAEKIVVRERAPNVDVVNANTGIELNQEILQNTAVRGRTFESVASLAPGSADVAPRRTNGGDVGVSFSGSTGNENALLIDGLNTTDLNTGVVATQLHQYFIKEINVITGGYQAEYGRATGGIVSVITNTGSNEFHGAVFGSWSPFQASPNTVSRLGEALATRSRQLHQYDYGFDIGGPILKDRIWFYVGFAPTITINRTERIVRNQIRGALSANGTYQAQRDPSYQAPPWLASPALSAGLDTLALSTVETSSRDVDETTRLYNWIGKLQFQLNPDHNITLEYIGAPQFDDTYANLGGLGLRNDLDAIHTSQSRQNHDAVAHYIGKLFDRKLQIDVLYGYHYQGFSDSPFYPDRRSIRYRAPADDPYSLGDFENLADCQYVTDANGRRLFNPCPVTDYWQGGYGQYTTYRLLQRHALQASGTLFAKFFGTHAIKLGFDFENNSNDGTRRYTGTAFDPSDPYAGRLAFLVDPTGRELRINRGYGLFTPTDPYFGQQGVPCGRSFWDTGKPDRFCYDHFRASTYSRNYALFLRDQWNVSFIPGLVINAGLRWEVQEVYASDGTRQIALWDNLSPRVGAAYDPSRKGRSKIYAQYGRFYESIPLTINDRSFSGEGFLVGQARSQTADCNFRPLTPGGRPVVVPEAGPGRPCTLGDTRVSGGGVYAPVAPGLKGQFLDEVVAGGEYDVGFDVVVGAYYAYRHLGNIIEDLSVNGGDTYFIANPGSKPDPNTAAQLEADYQRAKEMADKSPNDKALDTAATNAKNRLDVYKAGALFPKAQREYHAVTFTVNKRFANRFSLQANYTYSRLLGNYPGPYSPFNNQLDPNISTQFDIVDLTVNRNGPLVNDRPHNFKAVGFYKQPLLGGRASFVGGLTFTALSGRPIMVLGGHPDYGNRETFILPAGSGGRTPTITQLDMHLGWEQQLGSQERLSVYLDVINLLNQREVINIDDEYTGSFVAPIKGGKPEDLQKLRTTDGSPLVLNSNYAQPTAFQAPLALRFGARLSF